jgi:hypothetical protein
LLLTNQTPPTKPGFNQMKTLTPDEKFFYDQAGYSYDPKTETQEQGRIKCAKRLAQAELCAKQNRVRYEWERDDITSKDFSDEKPYYSLYVCVAYHNGKAIDSLGGIDFGRGNRPHGQPYKRVVEAELSLDFYGEQINSFNAACSDIETVA